MPHCLTSTPRRSADGRFLPGQPAPDDNAPGNGLPHEEEIIWLHPRDRYDYLRESTAIFPHRIEFPRRMRPRNLSPCTGDGTHLVAYATARPSGSLPGVGFPRRYWWVRVYDRWRGHGTDRRGEFYATNCPYEAVLPESIHARQPSTKGCHERRLEAST